MYTEGRPSCGRVFSRYGRADLHGENHLGKLRQEDWTAKASGYVPGICDGWCQARWLLRVVDVGRVISLGNGTLSILSHVVR